MKKKLLSIVWSVLLAVPVMGQQPDWQRMEAQSEDALGKVYYASTISPSFVGSTSYLTYTLRRNGRAEMYLVDAATGKTEPLIKDMDAFVAQYRTMVSDTSITVASPALWSISMADGDKSRFYWQYHGKDLVYNRAKGTIGLGSLPKREEKRRELDFGGSCSTHDKAFTMLGDRYNLWVRNNATGELRQLTTDGREDASYCYRGAKDSVREGSATGNWYGHVYLSMVYDDSEVGNLYILNQLARHRPVLKTKKMPLPNEKGVRRFRLYWYNADTGQGRLLPIDKWKDQKVELAYEKSDRYVWFTRRNRGVDSLELCRIELKTGTVTTLISEVDRPHWNVSLQGYRLVDHGSRIIWWSERTGRGNYYLYDGNGRLLNRITQGDGLVAGRIERIDTAGRYIIFAGYGQEAGMDPNYTFYYKATLDGRRQQLLTPGNGMHSLELSRNGRYAIDTYSRMDMPARYNVVSVDKPGRHFELYRVSDEALRKAGWQPPVLVKVKAADGQTDLYGVMYVPSHLDRQKKYPVISNPYPGPQDDQIPRRFTIDDNGNQQLAELGFIVVNVQPRGSNPWRDRAFSTFGYGNLRDYPIADDRHTIETLAKQYPFMDLDRVGIYGHSGGGFMTVTAMLTYPDFYKVGVAASGNHDNNNYIQWWGETYHGLTRQDSIPTNMQLADRLKGRLLLMHGDVDDNVPMTSTIRLADALIKAGKRFEMMILPGKDHGVDSPYYSSLIRYYFLENLVHPSLRDVNIIRHE